MKKVECVLFMSICFTATAQLSSVSPATRIAATINDAATGRVSASVVQENIGGSDDSTVSLLRSYIMDLPAKSSDEVTDFLTKRAVLVTKALLWIGNSRSVLTLLEVSTSCANEQVRSQALDAIAREFYSASLSSDATPPKEIVHALLTSVDDDSYVGDLQVRVGDIAREGLSNWLGMDFGEPRGSAVRIKVGKEKQEMTLREYREWWWNRNSGNLEWDRITGRFIIRTEK